MAYKDYGVLIKKNKQITLNHNDSIVINNTKIRFCYKNIIIGNNELYIYDLESYTVKYPYKKYRLKYNINGIEMDSKRIDEGDRYYTIIKYKNDLYEIIHGYGIDNDFNLVYNKTNKLMNKLNRFNRPLTQTITHYVNMI